MIVTIQQAKKDLENLIEKVLSGEDVVITKAGKPVAKLMPYQEAGVSL